MIVISNKKQILEQLSDMDKPSMLRVDGSYYYDINLIHCIIKFESLSINDSDELMEINIDESLVKQSSRVLIYITSGLNLRISELEAIAHIVSIKTNSLDYCINLQIDLEYDVNRFDLLLMFVEWSIKKSTYIKISMVSMSFV